LQLEHIDFNLGELITHCVQSFQHAAQQQGLALDLSLAEDTAQLQVNGDPTRIRQILLNLIGNALKFTEQGQVRVEARWQLMDEQRIWLTCSVQDTGIGIDNDRLEMMFVAFQQADSSISRRYGGTGLGKTHLMFAAGNAMRQANPAAKVLYLRSEQFFSAMIRALQEKTMDQFKRQFQQVDALLIDDIQFFAGKDRTQEEFFHTFNALFDGKQQIILTCDRYPREVEGLEARLKSRLAWGLSVAIEPPDFETRAAIVLAKARERGTEIPDDVAFLIAKKMRSNVRDLEGALNTLTARANFTGRAITTDFAQETLRDLLRAQQQAISIPNIQKTVADYYGLQIKDLLSKRRTRSLARPRQVAMALTKELTEHSLPEIGDAFAGRDHTTVLHACRQIRTLMETDGKLREDWDKLIRKLSE